MQKKIKTLDDILADRKIFTQEQAERIEKNALETADKIWGGKRKGAGRKPKEPGKVLKFAKRLTEKEAQFIDYARAHNINYDDLMQG